MSFKKYAWILFGCVLAPMLLIFSINLLLLRQPRNPDRFVRASEWQEKTRGITMVLLLRSDNGPVKTLRLNDRLPDINAVVFGSSTAMSFQADMFPPGVRIYNFSQPGNPLSATIGEVEYILDHHENIRWMFVPLEWAIGFLYSSAEPPAADLSRAHVLQVIEATDRPLPWKAAIKEALSYQIIKNQFATLRRILASSDKLGSFRSTFLLREGDDYICEDGLARDFEPDSRGSCFGFRYDGSMNFHIQPTSQRFIMEETLKVGSFVRNVLPGTKGQPRQAYLDRLAKHAHRLEQRGGRMVFFMPALLPGLEAEVLKQPDVGDYLRRTKSVISQWAEANKVVVFDFGPSEKFGCVASEFADGLHSSPPCYRKVLDATWRANPRLF